MAHASPVTVPVKADPRGLVDFARVVARHMTALADELEHFAEPEPVPVHYMPVGDYVTVCGIGEPIAATDELLGITCRDCVASEPYRSELQAFRDWQAARR